MSELTYPYLGDAVKVGDPLGCDLTGWPYRVADIAHGSTWTVVEVEPWPLPSVSIREGTQPEEKAAYLAAMDHARERMAGVVR